MVLKLIKKLSQNNKIKGKKGNIMLNLHCKRISYYILAFWVMISICNAQEAKVVKCPDDKIRRIVQVAVMMKKKGYLETTIVDSLYYHYKPNAQDAAHTTEKMKKPEKDIDTVFGNISLNCNEKIALKEAGFNDDFLSKIEGNPEYFSVGISSVWFAESDNIGFASMLRIFLLPKSYFDIKKEYFQYKKFGLFQLDRWDLNLGLTTTVQTKDNNKDLTEEEEKNSYYLIGFSHELHRYAFINLGLAYAPGCDMGHKKQFYIGLTVDYNLLKSIGLVYK